MESKHAFLIMAHSDPRLLKTLLSLLDHPRSHIFLHVDKKAPYSPEDFVSLLHKASLTLVKRMDVRWGGRSQIDCEMALLEAATGENCRYYHLLSGVDLPLKKPEEIFSFFDENCGKEFVNIQSPNFPEELKERFSVHWFFQESERKNGICYRLNHSLAKLQKRMGIDRTRKDRTVFYKGANWFSVTHAFATALLKEKKAIRRRWSNTRCCDEVFLQTFLMNSPFRDRLYDPTCSDSMISNMRYVDWKRGNPYTLRKEDVPTLLSSKLLFARKFDYESYPEAVEELKSALQG